MIARLLRRLGAALGLRVDARPARPEAGDVLYAIGDIHGRADLLHALFRQIDEDQADRAGPAGVEIVLGDFIDRGPASRAVMDLILSRRALGRRVVVLKGNHEEMLLRFLKDPAALKGWRKIGGYPTLLSFGVSPPAFLDAATATACQHEFRAALGTAHLALLGGLDLSFSNGGYFFAHAGVAPARPLNRQRAADLISIRRPFLDHDESFGQVVVHGHTPCRAVEFRSNRINIDTGAYATGVLTCLVLDGDGHRLLQT
ncbi:metallophosphoesterase [Aureimonas glaciei]|uniref:Metallophosphoesterase n=1 Tax=Aureimonas glaciei TaxID=1776957 RepID=A0A917DFF1_9HYPH|nr:metallophosphoesterase [Aureimonas glaciei]GGD31934.1 metallophosphoesterase [Aureimonas glaciei]